MFMILVGIGIGLVLAWEFVDEPGWLKTGLNKIDFLKPFRK